MSASPKKTDAPDICSYETGVDSLTCYADLIQTILNRQNRKVSLATYRDMFYRIKERVEAKFPDRTGHHDVLRRFELLEPELTRILGPYAR